MKKLILLLLGAVLLLTMAGCGANPATTEPPVYVPSDDPLTNLQNILTSGDKLVAVAYLGQVEGTAATLQEELSQKAFIGQVPFVADINRVVKHEGNQVFCIIPADKTVKVCVYQFGWNADNLPVIGEELISSNEAFLVTGNTETYVPNLYMVAEKGNRRVEYQLVRSGIEGRLENLDNQMFDFTPYNLLPEFHNLATPEKPLCAGWLGDIRNEDDLEIALLLNIHESGEVRFTYGYSEHEMVEFFSGTWEIDGDLLKLRMKGGKPGLSEAVIEKNIDFKWSLDAGVMRLQHIGGDTLYPGTEGKIIDFWSND